MQLKMIEKRWQLRDASLPGYKLENRGNELRNWGIRIIECSSVELKVRLWSEDDCMN
jgi:hypothetical protein